MTGVVIDFAVAHKKLIDRAKREGRAAAALAEWEHTMESAFDSVLLVVEEMRLNGLGTGDIVRVLRAAAIAAREDGPDGGAAS